MTTDPNETPRDPGYSPESPQTPETPETPQMPETSQTPQTPPQYGSGPYVPQEPVNPSGNEPYGTPPPPSGVYGTPPAGLYGPPPGGPYGAPPAGAGTYAVPLGPPVPAGMGNIWQKWVNVTTKPGVASFAKELPTANWSDIWLSLIGLGVLSAITGAIVALYTNQVVSIPQANGTTTTLHIPAASGVFSIIGVPLGFFIIVAILFVVAKIFGGTGTFLEQSYAQMLYYVPIQAVTAILGLVPVLGSLAAFVLWIYQIVLAVFAIAASQRLTIGKSVAVVLIPAVIVLLLVCGLIVILAAAIAAALNGTGQ
jgi:hypothetical protein